MKITDLLHKLQQPTFSFEIMPLKGQLMETVKEKYAGLLNLNPLFVDIPYHSQEYVPAFLTEKATVSDAERLTTEEVATTLLTDYNFVPLAHLVCRHFTPEETETALLQLWELGVKNVLLLRGDVSKTEMGTSLPGHKFAYQLTQQVKSLNAGINWKGKPSEIKTGFCIGVAGYPEKHAEASDYETGIQHLKQKQEAGADFIMTQLFYDNQKFFRFKNACRAAGITIPTIPAIAPVTSRKKLRQLPSFFKVSLPPALETALEKAKSEEEFKQIGINWAKKQARELIAAGEKLVHFFAFSEPHSTEKAITAVFNNQKAE